MKKLEFALFIIADFIMFAVGKKIFNTQYLQFFILAILLIGVNLFHVWFQTHEREKIRKRGKINVT